MMCIRMLRMVVKRFKFTLSLHSFKQRRKTKGQYRSRSAPKQVKIIQQLMLIKEKHFVGVLSAIQVTALKLESDGAPSPDGRHHPSEWGR